MNLRHQILALAVVPLVVAIMAITALLTWQSTNLVRTSIATFERNMLTARQTELLNLTNLALSAIKDIYENAGPDDEEAKAQVRHILTSLDYGQDGYFFVYDYNGNNIVHPRQDFRPGRNWLSLKDPDGNRVIAQLIEKARNGGGLYQYKWEKPSAGAVADKLSFAAGLDKWGWMIGTGVYLDDVFAQTAAANADLRDSIGHTFFTVAVIAVPAVLLVFATSMLMNLRQRRLADGKLKALTQRIIDTQEEERFRIARELHDGISQNLVGVRYAIDLARRKVSGDNQEAVQAIERGGSALNDAIKEVRRMSHELHPRVLDDLGLTAALEALVHNFSERNAIEATLEAAAFKNPLALEAKIALYRVAQEAFTNIERHANATRVVLKFAHIRTRDRRGRLQMDIIDNGQGFASTQGHPRRGLGLRNMQERMAHFGGHIEVETSSQGTRLTAILPSSALTAPSGMREAA